VTDLAVVIVTEHRVLPVQAPPQPTNVDPGAGLAPSRTKDPLGKEALHAVPQLIPIGLLSTVPLPGPAFVTVNTNPGMKVPVTDLEAVIATVQAAVPLQAPLQPANIDPQAGVAVSCTTDPVMKLALQVAPQLIPLGLLITVPFPAPAFVTVKTNPGLKVATTALSIVIGTRQVAVPEQAPLQPANAAPETGVAVSCTKAQLLNLALHAFPQLIPVGLLITVPLLVPAFVTVKRSERKKVAVTDLAEVIVSEHVPVPIQSPLQPPNTDPAGTAAVNVITVPGAKLAVQALGQFIPGRSLATEPKPASVTVRGKLVSPATKRYGLMLPLNGATDFAAIPAVVSRESVSNA
jgi:hypothetical protein